MTISSLPRNVGSGAFDDAVRAFRDAIGNEWVLVGRDDLLPYAVNLDPAGDVFPSAVVKPRSAQEVQDLVTIANRYRIPLYPISRGRQHGLGMATAVDPGNVIVYLGRMNEIVDYDAELGYVVLEPGVTFQQLYEFLRDRDAPFWISPISGPIDASVVANALDKGAGYTPAGFHFGNLIGLEIVLGDGRILTTGDGALPGARTVYTHKGGFGPLLDGLFAQANYGIVVRAGVWLMPAPPGARGFVFSFPEDADIGRAVDVAGRMKLTGAIPSTVSIANDLFCIAVETQEPIPFRGPGESPVSEGQLRKLRQQHDVGAWNVVGCLYGPPQELAGRVNRLYTAFAETGPVRYLDEEEASGRKAFGYRFDIAKGIPNEQEVDVYHLHANGSSMYFLPAVPFLGREAERAVELSRSICTRFGFSYTCQFLGSPRSMRNTQPLIFDSLDPDSRRRVQECFATLAREFQAAGYLISRPPTSMQDEVMSGLGFHSELTAAIKQVFDPNGILAPGRYGIRLPPEGDDE